MFPKKLVVPLIIMIGLTSQSLGLSLIKRQLHKNLLTNIILKTIEKMFIQYDLAYPSGTAFHSNIKLHSI